MSAVAAFYRLGTQLKFTGLRGNKHKIVYVWKATRFHHYFILFFS